ELKSAYYGIPASPGKCRGVITRNLRNLNENSILMLEDAQISEVHYIENIKGVVAAMGGMLSHLAIVCRELNKPFVVSILEMIPDGVYVEMDADKGCITVLESNIK
ncbi:MAG: PEP-utilizing enzyme, partial [Vampirovibrionia bacterium]